MKLNYSIYIALASMESLNAQRVTAQEFACRTKLDVIIVIALILGINVMVIWIVKMDQMRRIAVCNLIFISCFYRLNYVM